MASIAVKIVLEQLTALVKDEVKLLGSVCRGMEELRDDFDSMKSFLQDAESRSDRDQAVKTWINQVRDVAYDAEDAIEVFHLRLRRTDEQGISRILRKTYHFIQTLQARHNLATQISDIKRRIKMISERKDVFFYNKGDDQVGNSNQNCLGASWYDPRLASLYIDEADVVGIEKPRNLLSSWLVEGDRKLITVSVVGMGGVGKTTLVKKVFDSQAVVRCFNCCAWVTVSKSFTTVELLRAAYKGFLEATQDIIPGDIDRIGELQLVNRLRDYLEKKSYLIVLDDVWSLNAWGVLKHALPDSNCGSRVILTTRSGDLAASIEPTGFVCNVQPLPYSQAWDLFCMKAFQGVHKGICPQELEEITKGILKRCGGLPLAIVVISSLLMKKEKTILEWRKVQGHLAAEINSDYKLESLRKILLLSYRDLPYQLKSCYLYLSVFPEDYFIKRTKLTRLWIAERLVEERQGFTMEEVAEDYFNELVGRSMIQVVQVNEFGKVRGCRVHDIMREIIQSVAREEMLVTVVHKDSLPVDEKVRRISIHENANSFALEKKPCRLRTLLLFTSEEYFASSLSAYLGGFRLLRVLELEYASLSCFPPELVDLIHLRYLSLRRTSISELPEDISKLKCLEVLDLKFTFVSKLPVGILKLQYLREIRAYRYIFGSYFPQTHGLTVPAGIGNLTNIMKLANVNAYQNTLVELGQLTKLKRLGVLELKKGSEIHLLHSLEKLRSLTSFYMVSEYASDPLQLETLQAPPPLLEHLYLKCKLVSCPPWIASLHGLTKLVLQYSDLSTDPLASFQDMPNLVTLELRVAFEGEELCCDSSRGYPRLKNLRILLLKQLKRIKIIDGSMAGLRVLSISSCHELEQVPFGIEHLSNLQELFFSDMPYGFLQKLDRSRHEDFCKIKHIQAVKHAYESGGKWTVATLS